MSFEEFMSKEYPHYKSAGGMNIKMWKHIWAASTEKIRTSLIALANEVRDANDRENLTLKQIEQRLREIAGETR